MALMEIIERRKSVRKYAPRHIERKKIIQCIEAARLAPSADNMQPWRFIVIDEPEMKKAFCTHVCKGIYRRTRFIENAPVIVVILAKLNFLVHRLGIAISRVNIHLIDIGISGEHLVLQAQELGIGTCWINLFNVKKAAQFLALPNNYRVVSLIAMGYPAEGATRNRPDLPMENILYFNNDYKMGLK